MILWKKEEVIFFCEGCS